MTKEIAEQLNEYGRRCTTSWYKLPDHPAITDTLDYVLGLVRTCSGTQAWIQRSFTGYGPLYRPHLANYALEVSRTDLLMPVGMQAYHFNSGIQRLAAAFDRLPRDA